MFLSTSHWSRATPTFNEFNCCTKVQPSIVVKSMVLVAATQSLTRMGRPLMQCPCPQTHATYVCNSCTPTLPCLLACVTLHSFYPCFLPISSSSTTVDHAYHHIKRATHFQPLFISFHINVVASVKNVIILNHHRR